MGLLQNSTLVAAFVAAFVSLIGVLLTARYNTQKFKIDSQKWENELHQERETESDWVKFTGEIPLLTRTEMDEKTLLKVRNLLGALPGRYCDMKKGKAHNFTYTVRRRKGIQKYHVEHDIGSLDYYIEFKNTAIDYTESLHRVYFKGSNAFGGFTETEAKNIRMICRILTQDRWLTKVIDEQRDNLVSDFRFFMRLNQLESYVSKFDSKVRQCFNFIIILVLPLIGMYYGYNVTKSDNTLGYGIIVVSIVIMAICILRYIAFDSELKKCEEFIDRKSEQRKKAAKVLKKEMLN